MAFFFISNRFSLEWVLLSCPLSINSSIGPRIRVNGVLNSCEMLVKNFSFSWVASSAFSAILAMVSFCSNISLLLASSLLLISVLSNQLNVAIAPTIITITKLTNKTKINMRWL